MLLRYVKDRHEKVDIRCALGSVVNSYRDIAVIFIVSICGNCAR